MTTPQILATKLASEIGLSQDLYLKREDLNSYGSHKGRSIPPMIEKYVRDGRRTFIISSSGNAALAAAKYIGEYNRTSPDNRLNLIIFIGEKIEPKKLSAIREASEGCGEIEIRQTDNPKQTAFATKKGSPDTINLRQSTDDAALAGYESLANELAEIPDLAAVFIPTSSGTTAQGLYSGFQIFNIHPQIHIIQTPDCHPFIKTDISDQNELSLASAIVDRVGHRAIQISQILTESKGAGWIATNEEIIAAIQTVKNTEGIDISPNSALSVVGLKKAVQNGQKFDGPVVCLITGR